MKAFSFLSVLALSATLTAVQDSSKSDLSHRLKEGEVHRYKVVLKMDHDQLSEATASVEIKVVKTPDGKPVEAEFKTTAFKMTMNGSEAPAPSLPDVLKLKLDKYGMPEEFFVQDHRMTATAFTVCSYLPAKTVAVNEDFPIDWKSANGDTVKGSGRLTAIKTDGDRKIGVIRTKIEVQPGEETTPAKLDVESEFDLATGALLKATASGEIGSGTVSMSVTEVKEAK